MIDFNEFQFIFGCCNGHIKYIHETSNLRSPKHGINTYVSIMGTFSNQMGGSPATFDFRMVSEKNRKIFQGPSAALQLRGKNMLKTNRKQQTMNGILLSLQENQQKSIPIK